MIDPKKFDVVEILKDLLKNPRIQSRVSELKLTEEQMIDAIPVMIDMNNQDESTADYLVSFYVTKSGSIKRVELLSKLGQKKSFLDNVVTRKIYPVSFDMTQEFDREASRKEIVNDFVKYLETDDYQRGMFIYGPMGVGKTFILKKFARKLAEKGKKVGFISVPDLVSKVKGTFDSNAKYETLAQTLKTVDYLFVDDIGAEVISSWFRDEFLFSILNERMDKKLVTFFTSNYTFEQLEKAEAKTARQKYQDFDKASRLVDRVKTLSKPYVLKGKNRRY